MSDCSNCSKVIVGKSPVCKIDDKVYLISDFPRQGTNCSAWSQGKTQKQIAPPKKVDPLLTWIGKFKKKKTVSTENIPQQTQSSIEVDNALKQVEEKLVNSEIKNKKYLLELKETLQNMKPPIPSASTIPQVQPATSNGEINPKYALGWIVAAILSGVFVSLWFLGLIG